MTHDPDDMASRVGRVMGLLSPALRKTVHLVLASMDADDLSGQYLIVASALTAQARAEAAARTQATTPARADSGHPGERVGQAAPARPVPTHPPADQPRHHTDDDRE